MAFEKLTAKLDKYFGRLGEGEARKIRPADVGKIIAKLEKRRADLALEALKKPHKGERLTQKIEAADAMLTRARFLLEKVQAEGPEADGPDAKD